MIPEAVAEDDDACADGASSEAVVTRPTRGRSPMTSKKSPDTMIERRRSGSPPPVRFIGQDAYAASVSDAGVLARVIAPVGRGQRPRFA